MRARRGTALIALALATAGCTSADDRAVEAVQRADAFVVGGAYPMARLEMNKALAARDDVADYWVRLGRIELATQQFGAAYQAFSRAIELDQGNTEALQAVTELAFAGNLLREAERRADQMLSLAPTNVRAQVIKGTIALRGRKFDVATAMAEGALKANPSDESALVLKAKIIASQDGSAPAAAFLEKAAVDRPASSPLLMMGLAEIYTEDGDHTGLRRVYAQLARLRPDDVAQQINYARELYLAGDGQQAFTVVERVIRAHPDDAAIQNRIVALWSETGSTALTPEQIDALAREGSAVTRVALARYAIEDGRVEQGAALLRSQLGAAEVTAETAQANALYANAEYALGDKAAARARADRVLSFDERNPQALLLRARLALDARDFEKALSDAQLVASDNPQLVQARILTADIYVARREPVLADRLLRRASQDMPGDSRILTRYLAFLRQQERGAAALRLAREFTDANPYSIAGWQALGGVCRTMNDAGCAQTATMAMTRLRAGQSPLPASAAGEDA